MTEALSGLFEEEARARVKLFVARVAGDAGAARLDEDSAEAAVVAAVRQYPVRSRCAVLAWLTLEAALDARTETIYVR